jgi:glycerophosphoryl diester phosphodiesterase
MKTFAHRGWSAGEGENTIEAFKKSAQAGIDGVEFDVRYGTDGTTIVVTHNKPRVEGLLTLEEAAKYLQTTNLELLIEFKLYS